MSRRRRVTHSMAGRTGGSWYGGRNGRKIEARTRIAAAINARAKEAKS